MPGTDQRIDASPDMAAGQQPPRATLVSPDRATAGFVYELARHGLTVNGQSGGILIVLIFGVGTDYALLIVARYREELVRHEDRHGAMAAALRRVGPTILASGGTVALSLLCLLTASLISDKGLGPVCAIGVVVVVVVVVVFAMLTAPPPLLLIVGRGVFWPFVPHYDASVEANHAVTQKRLLVWLGGLITGRARPIWIITALLLGVMALVTLAEIGFIVAFGVLLDAFVVRSVLVPALVMDVGPARWGLRALWKQEHSATVTEEPVREVAAA
ncbi:MAG: MMPL family transporter [Acidimicrobiales bacterium]